jgi:translation initiation factor 2B subunit (eIF-2B alpha/beta/delta family)
MIEKILEEYVNHLEKLCDKGENFICSSAFNFLDETKRQLAETKLKKLTQEIENAYELLEYAKSNLEKSNYFLNFELKLKK